MGAMASRPGLELRGGAPRAARLAARSPRANLPRAHGERWHARRAWAVIAKSLPMGERQRPDPPDAAPRPPVSARETAPQTRHWILVVDDDRAIRTLLVRVLENAGYAVVAAGDATEAQDLMREVHPHLVVLDLRMPGMSGLELLTRTRRTPVIVLSGFLGDLTEGTRREANVVEAFQKPVGLNELRAAVRRALGD